jgi:hypothetical protein
VVARSVERLALSAHVPDLAAVKTLVPVLATNEANPSKIDQHAGKYLVFHLGGQGSRTDGVDPELKAKNSFARGI